jgi:hypothetical protein
LRWVYILFEHNDTEAEIRTAIKLAAELGMELIFYLPWNGYRSCNTEMVKKAGFPMGMAKPHCYMFWTSPQINWDGRFYGCCCNALQAFDTENAFSVELEKILTSPAVVATKQMLMGKGTDRNSPCLSCGRYKTMQAQGQVIGENLELKFSPKVFVKAKLKGQLRRVRVIKKYRMNRHSFLIGFSFLIFNVLTAASQGAWDKRYYMMDRGDSRALQAIDGQIYSSSDEKVVAVSGNILRATGDGDCTIYATSDGETRDFAHVTVGWPQQNPVLPYSWKMYVPDDEAHNFGGNIYIYGSLDASNVFCSPYYISLTSPDLKHWESQGQSFSSFDKDVDIPYPGRILWDSDGHYYDGKYYLYGFFEWKPGEENYTFVLESDSPMGPFKNFRWMVGDKSGKPVDAISTEVFTDTDGQRYATYSPTMNPVEENFAVIARLKEADVIDESSVTNVGVYLKDFYEAPSLRKRGDTYYLVYAENCDSITKSNHTPKRLSYATSKNIFGPYTYRGVIISVENMQGNVNIQGSIEQFGNDWYVFYHRVLNGHWIHRSLCIEKIMFDRDGLIIPVVPTSSGIAENGLDPTKTIRFNTAVYGRNYRFVNRGINGLVSVQSNAEIGFRHINFSGKEKALRLKGENLDKIACIKVLANGKLIGTSRGSGEIALSKVPKGKSELILEVYTTETVQFETMLFSR